jgi:hypothetical protein
VSSRLSGNRFSQQSGEKIILIVISKELNFFYECLKMIMVNRFSNCGTSLVNNKMQKYGHFAA